MAVFNHTAHKALWGWLADNPTKEKDEWPGWDFNGGDYGVVCDGCFACDYDGVVSNWGNESNCKHCPLEGMPDANDTCLDGNFRSWFNSKKDADWAKRKRLAEKIRDWPVKEGVETI